MVKKDKLAKAANFMENLAKEVAEPKTTFALRCGCLMERVRDGHWFVATLCRKHKDPYYKNPKEVLAVLRSQIKPKTFAEMGDKELKKQYAGLYDAIYNAECYGTRDMLNLEAIEEELCKRGYIIEESRKVRIIKGAPLK